MTQTLEPIDFNKYRQRSRGGLIRASVCAGGEKEVEEVCGVR